MGSYSYDLARMVFDVSTLGYIQRNQSIVMDYKININNLLEKDNVFDAGALGNYSLAGFEMVSCQIIAAFFNYDFSSFYSNKYIVYMFMKLTLAS